MCLTLFMLCNFYFFLHILSCMFFLTFLYLFSLVKMYPSKTFYRNKEPVNLFLEITTEI